MSHSINALIESAYRYYPRGKLVDVPGVGRVPGLLHPPPTRPPGMEPHAWPPVGYDETDEHRRVAALRVQAGKNREIWSATLERIQARIPERDVNDDSLNLLRPAGNGDSGYAGSIALPPRASTEEHHVLKFAVSFLVPYYTVWASSWTRPAETEGDSEAETGAQASADKQAALDAFLGAHPEWNPPDDEAGRWVLYLPDSTPPNERRKFPTYEYHFELSPDEQPYAQAVIEIIEATFPGYERMPPLVGQIIVPDAILDTKIFGTATIHDCLFTTRV